LVFLKLPCRDARVSGGERCAREAANLHVVQAHLALALLPSLLAQSVALDHGLAILLVAFVLVLRLRLLPVR
jgi:hypothetical protein